MRLVERVQPMAMMMIGVGIVGIGVAVAVLNAGLPIVAGAIAVPALALEATALVILLRIRGQGSGRPLPVRSPGSDHELRQPIEHETDSATEQFDEVIDLIEHERNLEAERQHHHLDEQR